MEDSHKEIYSKIQTGTVIAIMCRKIASKEKGERYFSCRWQDNEVEAEKVWLEILKLIGKNFEYEIVKKIVGKEHFIRKEVTVGIGHYK